MAAPAAAVSSGSTEYEEEVYLSLDGHRDGLRQCVAGRAECAARHVVRHRAERAARSRGGARVLFDARDPGRRQVNASRREQPQVHPREARRRRHPPARRGGALRVVELRVQTRRRSVCVSTGHRPRGRDRTSATPGGPDGKSSRSGCICRAKSGITTAGARPAATFSCGNSRWPGGCAERRSCSMPAWTRSRFSIARCGSLAGRSSPSPSRSCSSSGGSARQAPAEKRAA